MSDIQTAEPHEVTTDHEVNWEGRWVPCVRVTADEFVLQLAERHSSVRLRYPQHQSFEYVVRLKTVDTRLVRLIDDALSLYMASHPTSDRWAAAVGLTRRITELGYQRNATDTPQDEGLSQRRLEAVAKALRQKEWGSLKGPNDVPGMWEFLARAAIEAYEAES